MPSMILPEPSAFVSSTQYHSDVTRWSSTGLRAYADDPYAAFRKYVKGIDDGDRSETDAMRFGSAVHALVLDQKQAIYKVNVWDRKAKAFKDAEKAFPNKLVLTERDYSKACRCADEIMEPQTKAAKVALQLLTGGPGFHEWHYKWTDEETGIRMRSLLDRVTLVNGHPTVVELKTSRDPSPDGFRRQVEDQRYDLQAAINVNALDTALRANGIELDQPPGFFWVAIGNGGHHPIAVYGLKPASYEAAEADRRVLMARLSEHMKDTTGDSWRAWWERLEDDDIPTIEVRDRARRSYSR